MTSLYSTNRLKCCFFPKFFQAARCQIMRLYSIILIHVNAICETCMLMVSNPKLFRMWHV